MSAVLDRFEREYQQFHRLSKERATEQLKMLAQLEAACAAGSLLEITGQDFGEFAATLMSSGMHVNTVRKKLNMIRPFFSWAYATQQVTADQYLSIRAVKNPRGSTAQGKPNPYLKKELESFWKRLEDTYPLVPETGRGSRHLPRFIAGKGPWTSVLYRHAMRLQLVALVHLALDCGLRRGEMFHLTLDDLHYDNEYIVIHGKADPHTGEPKIRSVPFTTEARRAVREWIEFRALMRPTHSSPWLSCWGKSYANAMWYTRFKSLLQSKVGREWRWHRFRHTCATHWLRAGVDLEVVSMLLGHSSPTQTLCYAQIVKGDIADAMGERELQFDHLRGRQVW